MRVSHRMLETLKPLLWQGFQAGGQGRDRTADPRFFRPVLYQLSYLTKALGPAGPSVVLGGSDGI
jgi:hypothetical protein